MTPLQPLTLTPADIPQAQPPAINAINRLFRGLVNGLANQLTLSENLTTKFVTFPIPGGIPSAQYIIPTGLNGRCTGLMVWNVVPSTGFGCTVGTVNARWQDNGNGTITVREIAVLDPGPDYELTLLLWGEPI